MNVYEVTLASRTTGEEVTRQVKAKDALEAESAVAREGWLVKSTLPCVREGPKWNWIAAGVVACVVAFVVGGSLGVDMGKQEVARSLKREMENVYIEAYEVGRQDAFNGVYNPREVPRHIRVWGAELGRIRSHF